MPEISPWFIFDRRPEPDDLILFCLHFAGGQAAVFRQWQENAPQGTAICRVQMPGHGTRMNEPLLSDMESVLEGLLQACEPWLGRRFAFFGHSMGGTIAAEWTIRLQEENMPLPQCLFISASEPAHRHWWPPCGDLPTDGFRSFIFSNGGIPREVMEHEELMEIFEPILRADYTLLETWAPKPVRPIHVPMVAFAGLDDTVVPQHVVCEWKRFAASAWELRHMPGGHFFIQTHAGLVMSSTFDCLRKLNGGALE